MIVIRPFAASPRQVFVRIRGRAIQRPLRGGRTVGIAPHENRNGLCEDIGKTVRRSGGAGKPYEKNGSGK